MSTERIVVHRDVAEGFVTAFKKAINQFYSPGGPSPVLVSATGVSKSKDLVCDAVKKGADVILGNVDVDAHESSGTRMRPVVLGGVNKDMEIHYTESFGPTVVVYVVDGEDQAVELANDSDYGLAGAVFTENLATGLRIAHKYETG